MPKPLLHPYTETLNSKQKYKSRQAKNDALSWLKSRFPKAFDTETEIHALKIGIMKDILEYAEEAKEQGISKAKLREAVVVFTRRLDYLACLKSAGLRIDLEGQPVEPISANDSEKAALKIKKTIEKNTRNQKLSLNRFVDSLDEARFMSLEKEVSETKKVEIVIKNKTSKAVDPDAVNRLKLKLGLSKKTELTES